MVTVNQEIDYDQAEEIALEFNCICVPEEKGDVIAELLKEEDDAEEDEEEDDVEEEETPKGKLSLADIKKKLASKK